MSHARHSGVDPDHVLLPIVERHRGARVRRGHALTERTPAEVLFGIGAVSQYVGAAIAFGVFAELGVGAVVWIRVLTAAVVLQLWRRVRVSGLDRSDLILFGLFGVVLGAMNLAIYLAIDRLPLGNAVAIEFLGPIAVAALSRRTARGLLAVALAAVGVLLLADLSTEGSTTGVLLALTAGACWAGYIVLGKRVATTAQGDDGLTIAMLVAAAALVPVGIAGLASASKPGVVVIVLAMIAGVASSVVPYSLDQRILRMVSRARFALLQALLPVTALLVGVVLLGQLPTAVEVLGILLVATAIGVGTDPTAGWEEAA